MARPELVKYIKDTRKLGFSLDDIRDVLEKRGWPKDEVHAAIRESFTAHGAVKHHLDAVHTHSKKGMAAALTAVFGGSFILGVYSKPLSYLFPSFANPLGELLLAPMAFAAFIVASTLLLAVFIRKVLGVL